ncbi:4'-phosphopantetheinyl transferase superfamily protein [Corynebacterium aquatimens]|uniref:4'-phosphopantetheinyl transferase family protein n=1 Tax=Corynebacterium TaxID=1716 RepID=UPI001F22C914|nr:MULTISPECIES: 4'-phosphopantetheinyl transferase superfamily protein [Corynebacterium]QYH19575.1 4'-phosphopantetheinyl transferase superfamily protein [Corynebacterium aquatimens]UIZ91456.1 4'-phosphopantetheinyl transferase superfamily protein [Corynebacterium sp. CNCTC7651]
MQDHHLFPAAARVVYLRNDDAGDLTNYRDLLPSEREEVSGAVDLRKGEFGDARWCAHQALKELGLTTHEAILRGERGMPLWPAGFTGSLTHTEGLRAAVAAPTRHVRSMGLDAEPAQALPDGVLAQIARPEELIAVRRMQEAGQEWADRLLFCAKEATYKCWFPMTRRWLGFDEAEIELRTDGTFTSRLMARPTPAPFFEGRWVVRGGYVIASAFLEC